MRKLRRLPKPAMLGVKHLERRFLNRVNHTPRNPPTLPGKRFRLRDRTLHHLRLLDHVGVLFLESIRDAQQHPPKARTPISILRWEVCPTIKRLSLGRKKRRERPASLPPNRLHRRLIPRINARPLDARH